MRKIKVGGNIIKKITYKTCGTLSGGTLSGGTLSGGTLSGGSPSGGTHVGDVSHLFGSDGYLKAIYPELKTFHSEDALVSWLSGLHPDGKSSRLVWTDMWSAEQKHDTPFAAIQSGMYDTVCLSRIDSSDLETAINDNPPDVIFVNITTGMPRIDLSNWRDATIIYGGSSVYLHADGRVSQKTKSGGQPSSHNETIHLTPDGDAAGTYIDLLEKGAPFARGVGRYAS